MMCVAQSVMDVHDVRADVSFPGKKMTEVIGTPEYMAPEQIKGCYGPEVDIWSAGVVMYLAMGGVPPFWASSRDVVKKAIVEKEVSFKYPTWMMVSEDCKDCIGKMLVKEPLRRSTPLEILGEWHVLLLKGNYYFGLDGV